MFVEAFVLVASWLAWAHFTRSRRVSCPIWRSSAAWWIAPAALLVGSALLPTMNTALAAGVQGLGAMLVDMGSWHWLTGLGVMIALWCELMGCGLSRSAAQLDRDRFRGWAG